jgi:hypothetical protein
LAVDFSSRGVSFSVPLKNSHDGLRGFELKDADGYVLFFGILERRTREGWLLLGIILTVDDGRSSVSIARRSCHRATSLCHLVARLSEVEHLPGTDRSVEQQFDQFWASSAAPALDRREGERAGRTGPRHRANALRHTDVAD